MEELNNVTGVIIIAGGLLIVILIWLQTRREKRAEDAKRDSTVCSQCKKRVPNWFGGDDTVSLDPDGPQKWQCFFCSHGFPFYPDPKETEEAYIERYEKNRAEREKAEVAACDAEYTEH